MIKEYHKTKPNQRVRLKGDGSDNYYPSATSGSEGWVRKQSYDYGFPMVYIEWDKEHWAYNGEQDQWTFENHFNPIAKGQNMSDKDMISKTEFLEAMNQIFADADDDAQEEEDDVQKELQEVMGTFDEEKQWPSAKLYDKVLHTAVEEAQGAEAFLLITVSREDIEGYDDGILIPKVVNIYQNPESGILLEAQLTKLAAVAHEELAIQKLHEVLKKDE
jgi:BMFP domain-containing protein YqiC